jgi:HK97 gp10 family phage protein
MASRGARFLGTAASFYQPAQQLQSAVHIRSAYRGFVQAPNAQTAWGFGSNLVGVIGTERVVGALVKYGVKLAIKSHQADVDAGNEMVELMKSRVPVDTGTLLNGITMEDQDGLITVTASATRDDGADYARFVEFGTKGRSVADDTFFEDGASAGAALRPRAGDGSGSPAQPFFWNSAHEVADKHVIALGRASGEAANEEGF